jgi:transposase-like protein
MTNWEDLKQEYLSTDTSYRKLSAKHGVPFTQLKRRGVKEGWAKLKEQARTEADTKIIEMESARQANRYKRLLDISDELLDLVESAIKQARADDIVLERAAFKQLSSTIKDIKDIQSLKTSLDIEEQKQRIALMKKQTESGEKAPDVITVNFLGGDDSWQN